jgi:uncharacterized protein involved in exopolysaccharide biosynthesis
MRNQDDNMHAAPGLESPPAGYFLVVPPKDDEDDDAIDLVQTVAILRGHWKLLLCAVVLGGVIAAGISLQMRNVFRAQAIVAPTAENNSSGDSMKKGLGGIAELAGIDLGGGGGRKVEALATLMSPGLAREFITKYDLMPILYSERWDPVAKRWKTGVKVPTLEMGIKRFRDKRTVNENTKSGLVTVTVEWYSPDIAAKWTMDMIDLVNERMRSADIRTAHSSLDYLNREMANANTVELRQAISHLTEEQINNEMMANVQRDYAYHFIDGAVPPEIRTGPKRTWITIGGAVIGLLLGLSYITLRWRLARARSSTLVPDAQGRRSPGAD